MQQETLFLERARQISPRSARIANKALSEDDAAVRIQAGFRGKQAREQMRKQQAPFSTGSRFCWSRRCSPTTVKLLRDFWWMCCRLS
mmetsp:Transcript_92872/g.298757  ORF Transcript_92872/g.298757 Transcript_92872/m.298757 type:complete len:87 (-) Transcript_92872:132-392(-)